jgi:heptosyltransferase I
MKKIGLLRLSALGDVVLVVPLVNALLKAFPDAEITWVTTQPTVDLLGPIQRVKWVIVEKPKSLGAISNNRKTLRGLSFDTLLLLQASFSAHLVSMQISAKRKIGFDRRRGKDFHRFFIDESIPCEDQHFVDAYLAFAQKIGVVDHEVSWAGAFACMDVDWANRELPEGFPRVGIATTPSKDERRWSEEGYRGIIEHLVDRGIIVCLLGGDGSEEVSFNAKLASCFPGKIMNLTGKTTLPQWTGLISVINLLVAPDTGCVHVARALGTPVAGLYAVANPSLSGPYLEQAYCVSKYDEAFNKYLPGSKAKDFHQRVHHPDAMSLINAEEVIGKIDEALEALPS